MTATVSRLNVPSAAYSAGKSSQYHRAPARSGSGDASSGAAGTKLRDWARWFDENLDFVSGALDKLANFIIGNGITIEPMVRDRRGRLLQRVNDQIRAAILDENSPSCWSRDVNVTGEYTRGEQEWIACRTWLRDGEILARRVSSRSRRDALPHQIQLIEADYLPYELVRSSSDAQNAIVHGVEKNAWGRPVAFHLYRQHPGDIYIRGNGLLAGDISPVSAADVSHLKFSRRVAQTRGVPIFHAAMHRLDDISDYEDAHRIGARIAAHLLGSIKRSPDMIDYSSEVDEREWEMEHGQILNGLLPGEGIEWYKPEAPNPDATPFIDDQFRRVSPAFGMGFSTVSGKYDKSFSAARQEQSENWPNVDKLRSQFISDFARICEYEPALYAAVLVGRVKIPREADPDTLYAADYRGPARPTIDDMKQAKADQTLIEMRTDSRQGRIRERGRDPVKVDAEIEQDLPANIPGQQLPPPKDKKEKAQDA